jgi:hypothetical protein
MATPSARIRRDALTERGGAAEGERGMADRSAPVPRSGNRVGRGFVPGMARKGVVAIFRSEKTSTGRTWRAPRARPHRPHRKCSACSVGSASIA